MTTPPALDFHDLYTYMSHNCDDCARSAANDSAMCDIEEWLVAAAYADETMPAAMIERCGIGTVARCKEFEEAA